MMKKCKITVLKTALFTDLCETHLPEAFGSAEAFGLCPVMKEGDVFVTGGKFGNSKPDGFCEYAWQAVQIIASTLAGGGKVFGQDSNIACCNDGLRPVVMKLEAFGE